MSHEIAVDVRMIRHSGIGTYIQNILPRVMRRSPEIVFHLMGRADLLHEYGWSSLPNARLVECRSPIYSIAEQLEIPRRIPPHIRAYWAPHFNIPVFARCPMIVSVHDVFHLAMPQYVRGAHRRAYARAMFGMIARKAEIVICNSDFTLREVKRFTDIGDSKLRRVHLGVDKGWFDLRPGPNPHGRPYILYVGNVKPHKNIASLISAFRILSREFEHDLLIVGQNEGLITGDTQVEVEARGLEDRIRFTGSVPVADLQQYVLHADCLVLPSLYEGFGLPPLEAMACGCPTVVSSAASLPEVCGDASMYIDPRSPEDIACKVGMVLRDADLRSELRSKGKQHAARFCWDNAADEVIAISGGLLGAKPCT